MSEIACRAGLCYNQSRNIVVSEGADNTTLTLINLLRRLIVNTLPPHADNGNIPRKRCSSCENFFPATPEYFPRQKSSKDGLKPLCKPCQLEYNHAYYASHRQEISEQRKGYYQENQEHLKQYSAQYRIEHPEEVKHGNTRYNETHKEERRTFKSHYNVAHREERRIYRTQWHEEHREHERQYSARYNAEHREDRKTYDSQHRERRNEQTRRFRHTERGRLAHRVHQNMRHARKRLVEGTLTPQQIQQKLRLQRFRCYYCSTKFGKHQGQYIYHLEHTIPISRTEHNPRHDVNYIVLSCPACNLKKNNKLPHEWFEGGRLF